MSWCRTASCCADGARPLVRGAPARGGQTRPAQRAASTMGRFPAPFRMPSVFLLRRSPHSLLKTREALCAPGSRWICSGQAEQWHQALPALRAQAPDVLICDLRLLDGPVSALLRRLPRPLPRVLLLSPLADDAQLFEALAAGAHAYRLEQDARSLEASLDALLDGQASTSPALARQLLQSFGLPRSGLQLAQCVAAGQDHQEAAPHSGLSRAQQHLLSLFAHGLLEAEIAQRWQLTQSAIGQRVAELYAALHRRQPLRQTSAASALC